MSGQPQDADDIELLLKSMGVEDYEPTVVRQLLEFYHTQAAELLTQAESFKQHDKKQRAIDKRDVRIVVQSKATTEFVAPTPWQLIQEYAIKRNAVPLPVIPTRKGVLLPPDRHSLVADNYDVPINSAPADQN